MIPPSPSLSARMMNVTYLTETISVIAQKISETTPKTGLARRVAARARARRRSAACRAGSCRCRRRRRRWRRGRAAAVPAALHTARTTTYASVRPAADRVADELDAVAHAELAQQVRAVRLDGLLGQVQRLGDLLVGEGLGDQLQHFLLARGQRLLGAGARSRSSTRGRSCARRRWSGRRRRGRPRGSRSAAPGRPRA